MLYCIAAIHWQNLDILLCSTKSDSNIRIGNRLDISLKHHLVGNIIFTDIPFVQNNGISLPKIRQSTGIRMRTFQ